MPHDLTTLHGLALKMDDAFRILRDATALHLDDHVLVARVALFSGGNDSTTLTHLVRFSAPSDLRATHAAHANTTIGVEATRQFVRDICTAWALPLIERKPPVTYHDLVVEQGFPGPAMHYKMFQRLKERALRIIRRELVTNGRTQRVLFIAGRRRSESARRAAIPETERVYSTIWASPLANWTKDDLNLYREVFEVPRNATADTLGMSGECLCGAFAEPGEFERIAAVDSEAADAILAAEAALAARIERENAEARLPDANGVVDLSQATKPHPLAKKCQWGWGAYRDDPDGQPSKTGPLCSSCDDRFSAPLVERLPSDPDLDAVLARVAAKRAQRALTR